MEFSKQQLIGLGGGLLLLLGIFLPIISMPIVGSMSIFNIGRIDGYVLLGLVVISLILAFTNNIKPLRLTGGISALLVVFGFAQTLYKIHDMKSSVSEKLQGNPFGGMAEAMVSTVQVQYGWVFLFVGCFMILYAALGKQMDSRLYINARESEPSTPIEAPKMVKKTNTKLVAEDMFAHNAGNFVKDPKEFKDCPFCAEQIRVTAIKCRHCGSMLEEAP
ncbi:zinc ribbon domain-containing protein [Acinetobacter sp. ANC 7454]|uniref:zinc ribbon domain-containing protein n=1 Tax=Acinetobacter thermotolerans TaxID=3151487 RepID=UPI00325AAB59